MFQNIQQGDPIETIFLKRLILDRAQKHGDAEGLLGVFDYPGGQFESHRLKSRPLQQGDKSPVSASEFQNFCRRNFVLEQGPQPIEAALGEVGAGAGKDVGKPKILFLMGKPVSPSVKVPGIVFYPRFFRPEILDCHKGLALRATPVCRRKGDEV